MINVCKYTIRGSYGLCSDVCFHFIHSSHSEFERNSSLVNVLGPNKTFQGRRRSPFLTFSQNVGGGRFSPEIPWLEDEAPFLFGWQFGALFSGINFKTCWLRFRGPGKQRHIFQPFFFFSGCLIPPPFLNNWPWRPKIQNSRLPFGVEEMATRNWCPWRQKGLGFLKVVEVNQPNLTSLRIMESQNWWFGDPRPLLYTSKPLYSRDQWFLGFPIFVGGTGEMGCESWKSSKLESTSQ